MAEGVVPAPRYGHVAAAVEQKLYLWGGLRRGFPAVHDGPAKTAVTSVVDVLDLQVKKINYIYIYIYIEIIYNYMNIGC